MPLTDIIVLSSIALGVPALIWRLRHAGLHGARLARGGWIAFTGLLLVATMSMHTVDVLSRLYVREGYDGRPWSYDFRTYSLLLLGVLLAGLGVRLLRAAPLLDRPRSGASGDAFRSSAAVLLLVGPLVPVHAFFAVPLTVVSTLNLVVLLASLRATANSAGPAVSTGTGPRFQATR